jgi:hypothetical protein
MHPAMPLIISILAGIVIIAGYLAYARSQQLWPFGSAAAHTWQDKDTGYSLGYNPPLRPYQDSDLDYLPLCGEGEASLCLVYPRSPFPTSNYSGAGLSLTIGNCWDPQAPKTGTRLVGGRTFDVYQIGDAGAGHQSNGMLYRSGLGTETCLDLMWRINTTAYDNYPAGSISRFTDGQRQAVTQAFEWAVGTFSQGK